MHYGLYEGVLAEAVNQLKFHGIRRLSDPLGRLMLTLTLPVMDGIVPVPLHPQRLRERGFNQSLLLARVISKEIPVPLLTNILRKKKGTPPQTGLSAKERRSNLKNSFAVNGKIENLRLFLCDDVMTTGATATECSNELMKAGAQEIIVLTLARSPIA